MRGHRKVFPKPRKKKKIYQALTCLLKRYSGSYDSSALHWPLMWGFGNNGQWYGKFSPKKTRSIVIFYSVIYWICLFQCRTSSGSTESSGAKGDVEPDDDYDYPEDIKIPIQRSRNQNGDYLSKKSDGSVNISISNNPPPSNGPKKPVRPRQGPQHPSPRPVRKNSPSPAPPRKVLSKPSQAQPNSSRKPAKVLCYMFYQNMVSLYCIKIDLYGVVDGQPLM